MPEWPHAINWTTVQNRAIDSVGKTPGRRIRSSEMFEAFGRGFGCPDLPTFVRFIGDLGRAGLFHVDPLPPMQVQRPEGDPVAWVPPP